jgi:uncharacterized membrane protein
MSALSHPRRTFVAGLLVVLPLAVTYWLLNFLFRSLDGLGLARFVEELAGRRLPGLGTVLTLGSIYLVGLLASNIVGARVVAALEALLLRVPLVRGIFGPAKQLFMALGSDSGSAQEVVAVEYPRRGLFMVGFVTQRQSGSVCVFLPTSPNPTSGFLVVCEPQEVHSLGIPFETAMRLIVSGGVVHPGISLLPSGARGGRESRENGSEESVVRSA